MPDGRCLERDPEEAEPTRRDEEAGAPLVVGRPASGEEREAEAKGEEGREEPPAPVAEPLDEGRRGHGVGVLAEPPRIGDTAPGEDVPGEEDEAQPDETEPGGNWPRPPRGRGARRRGAGWLAASHFGRALTSRSQRWRSRLRSAEEPYFAKS